jgi:ribosomal protein L11 methyltransferase
MNAHPNEDNDVTGPADPRATSLSALVADRDFAHRIAGALQDLIEPLPNALSLFEEPGEGWRIQSYYDSAEDAQAAADVLESALGEPSPPLTVAPVPDVNWVALSQAALPPVAAGRFTVHGSHDAHRVGQGPGAILIDAGEAFGTAHHATTYGCLLAIDRLTRRRNYTNVLDLGCGSGVLSIAVARALPDARIMASDLDEQSVAVAASNIAANRAASRISAIVASGLDHPRLRTPQSYDLLIANILAAPLIMLAGDIARATRPGGHVVLSGLLTHQAREVSAAYRAHGFYLEDHARIVGWSTLVLRRASDLPSSSQMDLARTA